MPIYLSNQENSNLEDIARKLCSQYPSNKYLVLEHIQLVQL